MPPEATATTASGTWAVANLAAGTYQVRTSGAGRTCPGTFHWPGDKGAGWIETPVLAGHVTYVYVDCRASQAEAHRSVGTGRRGAGRLRAHTAVVDAIDMATREAMWRLYAAHYERVNEQVFFADLDAKDDAIVVRDAVDGSVQGFTTLAVRPHREGERRFTIVFSGDTIIAPAYQGQSALQRAFVRYVIATARPGAR